MIQMQDRRPGRRFQSMLNMHQFLSAVGFSLLAGGRSANAYSRE
jgi:hypothetical protein